MANSTSVICLIFISQIAIRDVPTISIRNTYGEQIELWFKSEATGEWLRPPLLLPRNGRREIRVETLGNHTLVARDLAGRDKYLGSYNLRELAENIPDATLYLDSIEVIRKVTRTEIIYQTEAREYVYTIRRPVWENRTKLVTVFDPYTQETRTYSVDYKVCRMVPEQRTRTYFVEVPIEVNKEVRERVKSPTLKVIVNGRLMPLDEHIPVPKE